ncbi:MAG: MopE-related protein [Myxococcota bacterium]
MRWFRLFVVTVSFALGLSACNCARPPVQETLKNEGEACEADDECASRLCDKLPGKSKVCFRRCSTNCNPGDICTALAPNDRFACVPEKPGLCQPCALNVDCPYPGDRCIELGGTKVCARDCSFDGQCPSSYRCADGTDTNGEFVTKQCQPTSGTCECTAATAGQTRPCSETNSIGTCTGVQTCRPPNGYDACSALVPSAESCNGRDDDCNGMTDENLGETTCGTGECRRTVSNCVNGSPQICEPAPAGTEVCDDKDNDCDGVVDDGFDKMTSLTHCGACNTPCARANATPVCTGGMCGIQACNPGFVNADGIDSNGCEYMCTPTAMGVEICDGLDNDCDAMIDEGFSLASDPTNCGLCGRVCNVNNGNVATYACVAASCGIGTCNLGFADCDQTYSNGCEKNVSNDVANCGACNSPCMVAHGTPGCANSTCTVASCDMGWGNCNNMASDGCEQDTTGSIAHCGACNSPCPTRANAASICTASSCGYTCNTGYVDLDGLAANGCEYQCTAIGSDMPDYPMFVDANCDGVDGDAS